MEPCPGDEPNLATSSFQFRMKWKVYSFTKRGFVIALLLLSEKVQYDRDYHYHCDYQYYACLLITMIVNCYYDCN